MNENQRVYQVLSGNTSAFAYFVDTYQDMAITIAHRICGNMQDAEDVVQESFVKAFKNLHSYRSESKFSTWLYRIVFNTAITQARIQIWTVNWNLAEEMSHPTEDSLQKRIEEAEHQKMVADILQKMPKGDALILTLYYLDENSVKEIAQITGLNDSNVKVKLFRARKVFKDLWIKSYNKELW